jgi:hypothetical protein
VWSKGLGDKPGVKLALFVCNAEPLDRLGVKNLPIFSEFLRYEYAEIVGGRIDYPDVPSCGQFVWDRSAQVSTETFHC